jgi:hypothetical protein
VKRRLNSQLVFFKTLEFYQHLIFGLDGSGLDLTAVVINKRNKVLCSKDAIGFEWPTDVAVHDFQRSCSVRDTFRKFLASLFLYWQVSKTYDILERQESPLMLPLCERQYRASKLR